MSRIDDLAKDFLAQQRIAVAGVSETPETTGNFIYKALRSHLVRQCVKAEGPRVWLHCMLGTQPHLFKDLAAKIGSVSPEAVRLCQENGDRGHPGKLPHAFLGEDFGHTFMRGFLRMTGALEVPEGVRPAGASA